MKIESKELERAEVFIEAGDYASAGEIADKVLLWMSGVIVSSVGLSFLFSDFLSKVTVEQMKEELEYARVDQLLDETLEAESGVEMFQNPWEMFQMAVTLM